MEKHLPNKTVPVCPYGFDCGSKNACPTKILDCPAGFFCASYAGFPDEGLMDFRYADYKMRFEDVEITNENKYYYIDPNRAIQCSCLLGFYCPYATTMLSCPSNDWCSEGTVDPFTCDPLSMCASSDGYYQINFINIVIALVTTLVVLLVSTVFIRKQIKNDERSRKIDGESEKAKLQRSRKHSSRDNNHSSNRIVNDSGGTDAECYIEVSFQGVNFSFPNSEKKVLSSVSGTIPGAKMTLLLGPSASGKTSLLQVLRTGGRMASSGSITYRMIGNAMINNPLLESTRGEEDLEARSSPTSSLLENMTDLTRKNTRILLVSELSKYVGYVPQDDILDRALTVREQLAFHAHTRLLAHQLNSQTIKRIVEETLIELNIIHIANAIIGGSENAAANISGGQLKRVNIACELVALSSPAVLLLDEPTNGLDASIAYELIESLAALKQKQITIFTVLQQPRSEIFDLMDHLFLMGPHGDIVYEGSVQEVSSKLQSLGFQPYSLETSDADFCIDVLNQMKCQSDYHTIEELQQQHLSLNRASEITLEEELISGLRSIRLLSSPTLWRELLSNVKNTVLTWQFYQLIYLHMKRLFQVRLRNRVQLLVNLMISVIMAIALASGFSIFITGTYLTVLVPPVPTNMQGFYPQPLGLMRTHNADQFGLTQLLFFLCASLGCASCLASVPVFANHRAIALRERSCGLSITAYGIGRMVGDLPFVFMISMMFTGVWCCFGMSGSWANWMGTCVCTTYAASGIGYITGVLSMGNNANVYAIILTFIFCVFSGTEPSLAQVSQYPVVSWPWYLSFGTWTSEAAYVTWSEYLSDNGAIADEVQQGADTFGYDVSHGLTRSALALLSIGTGMRIIVLIILNYI